MSEFWHIHPFREGNTRTSAMALYFLIKKTASCERWLPFSKRKVLSKRSGFVLPL
ncbi:MAG: Fic family protein [Bacilli bacterium]|nr:Fic family protein [Bacilli bacterium]